MRIRYKLWDGAPWVDQRLAHAAGMSVAEVRQTLRFCRFLVSLPASFGDIHVGLAMRGAR